MTHETPPCITCGRPQTDTPEFQSAINAAYVRGKLEGYQSGFADGRQKVDPQALLELQRVARKTAYKDGWDAAIGQAERGYTCSSCGLPVQGHDCLDALAEEHKRLEAAQQPVIDPESSPASEPEPAVLSDSWFIRKFTRRTGGR